MKKIILILSGLVITGFIMYGIWFYNPYDDSLRLNPQSLKDDASSGLFIRNATLIDVEVGEAVPNAHVIIRGDTISEVFAGDEPDAPEGLRVIDAQDKFIMPGLIDVHVHLAMHWNLISGNFSPDDSLVTRVALEQFVRYGVTTVLALGGGGANDEQVVELKQLEENNSIVAPWLFAVGDLITVPGSHPITTIMRLSADESPERLHQAGVIAISETDDLAPVLENKKRLGLDGVKIIIESGPPPFYPKPRMSEETAAKIINHARTLDLPVYAHTEYYAEFKEAVHLGVYGIMHSVIDTLIHNAQLIERMKQEETWYVPSLSIFYGFQYLKNKERLEDSYLQEGVSKRVLKGLEHPLFQFGFGGAIGKHNVSGWLENGMQNLARLHSEGINVALGTDASTPYNFPGYNAHVEMELMSRAGLSNADILRIATINGAKFLRVDERTGSISPGKIANLIILENNPLSNIQNTRSINKVILKGHLINLKNTKAIVEK